MHRNSMSMCELIMYATLGRLRLRRELDSELLEAVARTNSLLQQISQWTQIKVQVSGSQTEMLCQFADFRLERHQRLPHFLDLRFVERPAFHPANCLAFQQLTQKFDQTED